MAVRQIEISGGKKMCYDASDPVQAEFVNDQKLEEFEVQEKDLITKEEFEDTWDK